MKQVFLLYGLFLIVASIGFDVRAELETPYTVISAEELVEMQEKEPYLIVIDSRGNADTLIKGAIHLSAKETNEATLAKIVPNKEANVVFYCTNKSCPASAIAGHKADAAGYTNTFKLPGGIEEWKQKGLPTESI